MYKYPYMGPPFLTIPFLTQFLQISQISAKSSKSTPSRPQTDPKLIRNRPQTDPKSTQNRPQIDLKSTPNRLIFCFERCCQERYAHLWILAFPRILRNLRSLPPCSADLCELHTSCSYVCNHLSGCSFVLLDLTRS